jgi:hypothetical protein
VYAYALAGVMDLPVRTDLGAGKDIPGHDLTGGAGESGGVVNSQSGDESGNDGVERSLSGDAVDNEAAEESRRARKRIMFYLTNLRGIKLSINGRDLREMGYPPSPMYNVVLKELLTAKLNGRVKTPEDEINFVIERLSKAVE